MTQARWKQHQSSTSHTTTMNRRSSGVVRLRVMSALALSLVAGHAAVAQPGGGGPPRYRPIDGTGTNAMHPTWGMAGARYLREASGAHYTDGVASPAGATRPSPRFVSNEVSAQPEPAEENGRGLSTCVYEFGQFLDHDFGLALGGTTAFPISVPLGDAYFDPFNLGTVTIPFTRSAFDPPTGTTTPGQQVNLVTSFIDASQVYGSDATRAAWLRTGMGGHLKTTSMPFGTMLPLNDGTQTNDNPTGLPATSLYVAGDVRANEQVGLTVLQVIFLREHNYQADRLHALHPAWNDEQLYQEARRLVGAEMQSIVYREFLPAIIGNRMPPYTGFHPNVNPGMSNSFAAAAYRIGHSMVGADIDLLDQNFELISVLELSDAFFNPDAIPLIVGGIDPVVRYFVSAMQQEVDTQVVDPLRNFLFGPPGAGGLDLVSLNIQRGRDHGLADYNTMRADFGLPRVSSFAQITSNASLASSLESLYGTIDDIDPWVGLLAEDHLPGATVGETHAAIFIEQFRRLRDGDPFWYRAGGFTQAEIAMIESTHLSDIFLRTTGVAHVQTNVFFAVTPGMCPADFNNDGVSTSQDFFDFLSAFFASSPAADFNADMVVNSQDFFDFISAFLIGC